jgi:hypothetical protein
VVGDLDRLDSGKSREISVCLAKVASRVSNSLERRHAVFREHGHDDVNDNVTEIQYMSLCS